LAVVFPDATLTLIVVNVEYSFAGEGTHYDRLLQYQEFYQSPAARLAEVLLDAGLPSCHVGVELDHLPAQDVAELRELLPTGTELRSCGGDVLSLREVKLDWELEQIRRAASITDTAYESLFRTGRVGWSELQVAEHLSGVCQEEGVDQVRVIVGSGTRSLYANAYPTAKRIEDGDVIRLDLLCQVNGYWADIARSMAAGKVPADADLRWNDLVGIHSKLLKDVKAGVRASTVHEWYESSMSQAGMEMGLTFLGHGLGLTLHEEPYLRRGNERTLVRNSVLCFEPYTQTDSFALHVEDEVYLDAAGSPQVLTTIPDQAPLPRLGG